MLFKLGIFFGILTICCMMAEGIRMHCEHVRMEKRLEEAKANELRKPMTFGYKIVFTPSFRSKPVIYDFTGFKSAEAMEKDRARTLKLIEWTPPRWWQWRRRHDTRLAPQPRSDTP
jgi:hypothetical protein